MHENRASPAVIQTLLGVSREYGNVLYRDYIGILFPLLDFTKSLCPGSLSSPPKKVT